MIEKERWCRGCDLNARTTKDRILSPTPLAKLGYPCFPVPNDFSLFILSVYMLLEHDLGVLQGLLSPLRIALHPGPSMNAIVARKDN